MVQFEDCFHQMLDRAHQNSIRFHSERILLKATNSSTAPMHLAPESLLPFKESKTLSHIQINRRFALVFFTASSFCSLQTLDKKLGTFQIED